jgi:hypothetical protein
LETVGRLPVDGNDPRWIESAINQVIPRHLSESVANTGRVPAAAVNN